MANQSSSTAAKIVDVADRLHSAAIHMLRYLRRADAATGLTAARASVLSVVVFGGPVTIGDLATAEQVSAPTMTKLITSLEGEGLVRRVADDRDRRVVRVHATPQAARILRRGRAARVRVLAATLRALDPVDLATLGRAADILRILGAARAQKLDRTGQVSGLTRTVARHGAQKEGRRERAIPHASRKRLT